MNPSNMAEMDFKISDAFILQILISKKSTYKMYSESISFHIGVAFCDPMEEFIEIVAKVPPELLKVFRISQLTIQYLLKVTYSQNIIGLTKRPGAKTQLSVSSKILAFKC